MEKVVLFAGRKINETTKAIQSAECEMHQEDRGVAQLNAVLSLPDTPLLAPDPGALKKVWQLQPHLRLSHHSGLQGQELQPHTDRQTAAEGGFVGALKQKEKKIFLSILKDRHRDILIFRHGWHSHQKLHICSKKCRAFHVLPDSRITNSASATVDFLAVLLPTYCHQFIELYLHSRCS